ncbi:MAG: coproporphyrinogen III oxidase family protein [Gammaproteobacteria bacterium]
MRWADRLMSHYLQGVFNRRMRFELGGPVALPEAGQARPEVLYIHIPFCESLCPFCSFHRVLLNRNRAQTYFRTLRDEIRQVAAHGYRPSVVYVGGGTPTVLPDELCETLALVGSLFPVRQISTETNPNHLREDIFVALKQAGVNRVSVGVQSFDDRLLRAMGRYDSYGSGEQMLQRLIEATGKFDTLNADMILNLPTQTQQSLQQDIHLLRDVIGIDQVSWYPLMTSSHTGTAMERSMGRYSQENEKPYYDLIRQAMDGNYQLSSVWCMSRKQGLIDEYITADTDYIGVGSGSFSYLDGTLYANTFSLQRYTRFIDKRGSAITAVRRLSLRDQAHYDMVMTLFGLNMDVGRLDRKYRGRLQRLLWKELLLLRLTGSVRTEGGQMRLTRRGQYEWVIIMREFFSSINNFRDQMRRQVRAELDIPGTLVTT